ncbi:uncharacterized protein LOC131931535 isoform X2 [Physella acuta]|uniref:uncharacterized protein LOC131931535 isoform X2 n=1 Tax=Physella acuta TaxID=109671 RepID=UPI0027DAC6FC|nr:uncharacterized protein LOC131931535 isoform X2 [Physella acuta]
MSWKSPRYHYYSPDCNPYPHWATRHYHRGGSMFGRLFFFLVGVYAGVAANQRYRLPDAPTPCDGWRHHRRCRHDEEGEQGEKKQSRLDEFPEIKEAIEKLKALERRYRKSTPSDETASTSSPASPGFTKD